MSRSLNNPGLAAAAIIVAMLFGSPQAAAAGLFDAISSIFGADPPPMSPRIHGGGRPYGFYDQSQPLGVTVRGRAQRERRRAVRADAPGPKPLNTSIDPVKYPDWYLHDPTLRRGDIVVLKNRVLVVDGGATDGGLQLTPLDRSRLVSKSEQQKVRAMAGLPPEVTRTADVPPTRPRTRTAAQATEQASP